jgi:hypothetical protein
MACPDYDDTLCLYAEQLLRAVSEAVQTAYALGAANGQYALLCESIYAQHITIPDAVRLPLYDANYHLSGELMHALQNNSVLKFEVGRVGRSGQYSIHGPSLNIMAIHA